MNKIIVVLIVMVGCIVTGAYCQPALILHQIFCGKAIRAGNRQHLSKKYSPER